MANLNVLLGKEMLFIHSLSLSQGVWLIIAWFKIKSTSVKVGFVTVRQRSAVSSSLSASHFAPAVKETEEPRATELQGLENATGSFESGKPRRNSSPYRQLSIKSPHPPTAHDDGVLKSAKDQMTREITHRYMSHSSDFNFLNAKRPQRLQS